MCYFDIPHRTARTPSRGIALFYGFDRTRIAINILDFATVNCGTLLYENQGVLNFYSDLYVTRVISDRVRSEEEILARRWVAPGGECNVHVWEAHDEGDTCMRMHGRRPSSGVTSLQSHINTII